MQQRDATKTAKRSRLERIYRERAANLKRLAQAYGSASRLATALGVTPQYVDQLIGPNPRRTVSEASAREFEAMLGYPSGWLDAAR
jgi:glutamine synthetase adenylyltransferase